LALWRRRYIRGSSLMFYNPSRVQPGPARSSPKETEKLCNFNL
jgi:hypothetical protein